MLAARKEEKILPASVIRDALEEQVAQIELEQSRKVSNKEKKQIKDDVTLSLLPKAFTRYQDIFSYIDVTQGWLIIDASSFNKAEELTSYLRGHVRESTHYQYTAKKPTFAINDPMANPKKQHFPSHLPWVMNVN